MKACSAETVASPSGRRWRRAPVVTNRVHFCRSLQGKPCLAVPAAEKEEGGRKKEINISNCTLKQKTEGRQS